MNPTHIPGANRVLVAPRDWDAERNGPCEALPVIDSGEFFQSAWIPDPLEVECMRAGAPCVVTIWGRGLPPHSVSVMPKPGFVPAESYQQAFLALRNLVFMCRTARGINEDTALIGSIAVAEKVVGEIKPDARRKEGDAARDVVPKLPESPFKALLQRAMDVLRIDEEEQGVDGKAAALIADIEKALV